MKVTKVTMGGIGSEVPLPQTLKELAQQLENTEQTGDTFALVLYTDRSSVIIREGRNGLDVDIMRH